MKMCNFSSPELHQWPVITEPGSRQAKLNKPVLRDTKTRVRKKSIRFSNGDLKQIYPEVVGLMETSELRPWGSSQKQTCQAYAHPLSTDVASLYRCFHCLLACLQARQY